MNFKETEIGLIPCEWEYKSIGDCLYIKGRIGWKGLKKSEYLKKSNYRIINGSALNGKDIEWDKCGYISEERYNESPEIMLEKNDIVMTKDGTIGKVAIIDKLEYKTTVASGLFVIRVLNNSIDYKYLYYYFTSKYFSNLVKTRIEGSVIPHLYQKDLVELNIPLPQLNEQKAISKILSDLDKKIETNNKINKKLEEMAQAIFKQWFVDFEFPNEDGKPYKSSGGEMVESELGMIPKGWEIGAIGDYVKVKSGFAFKSAWWEESGIPVIKIKDISNNTINFNDISYVSEDKVDSAKDFIVNGGDLLIAMTGATIGKFAIVPPRKSNVLVNQRVGKFFLGENPLKKLGFIYCILCRDEVYNQIVSRGDGSAQPNISPSNIESIKIILPSKDMIEKFNASVKCMFEKIIRNVEECNKLITLRDTLLPKLMSGEIRVPMD